MARQGGAVLDDVEPQSLQLIEQISAAFEVAATPHRANIRPLDGVYRSIFSLSMEGFKATAYLQESVT